MHNQFKSQKFKHLMLAMGPRDLNSAPYSPVHCSTHSMTSFQSSELTKLPVVENGQLFAQRAHSACTARAQRTVRPHSGPQKKGGPKNDGNAVASRRNAQLAPGARQRAGISGKKDTRRSLGRWSVAHSPNHRLPITTNIPGRGLPYTHTDGASCDLKGSGCNPVALQSTRGFWMRQGAAAQHRSELCLRAVRVRVPGAPGIQTNVPAIYPNAFPPNIAPSSSPGYLPPAVSGARVRAEWVRHPCLLGGPQHGERK